MRLFSPCTVVVFPIVFFLHTRVAAREGDASSRKIDSLQTALRKTADSLTVADLSIAIYNHYKYEKLTTFAYEYNYLVRALNIYHKAARWEKAAYACKALGGIHYNRNQTDKAQHYWIDALDLYTRAGNREGQATVLNNLSLIVPAKKRRISVGRSPFRPKTMIRWRWPPPFITWQACIFRSITWRKQNAITGNPFIWLK